MEEEIDLLEAIYIDDLKITKSKGNITFSIELNASTGEDINNQLVCLTLSISLNPNKYPYEECPEMSISRTRGISDKQIKRIITKLKDFTKEMIGEPMVYGLIELAREHLTDENIPEGDCSICRHRFDSVRPITRTLCYHFLHTDCLVIYADYTAGEKISIDEVNVLCPICRTDLAVNRKTLRDTLPPMEVLDAVTEVVTLTRRQIREQKYRKQLYEKQLKNDSIIDVESERNRFLIPNLEQLHLENFTEHVAQPLVESTAEQRFPIAMNRRNGAIRYYNRK